MKKLTLLLTLLFTASLPLFSAEGTPIRPIAEPDVIVGTSPDAMLVPLYNPTILALPGGRLVAGYYQAGRDPKHTPAAGMRMLTSDDRGLTWQYHTTLKGTGQGRLIIANKILYLVGSSNPLRISKSTDNGTTWSEPAAIAPGGWHQSATNFIRANGNVYLCTEKRIGNEITSWYPGELSPIVMRGKETDDLTNPKSWTFSNDYAFKEIIPGYRENDLQMDYFGVPFFPQNFPGGFRTSALPTGPARNTAPFGWLEANIAQITDPNHYWYDPAGKTFHILMRAHTGGTGYAALAKTVENPDGTMTTSLEKVPSGKTMLFMPLPGGQMRFHINYDEKTKLYWLLSTQATDSMTRSEKLPPERFDLPNNERQRLVLHFSKNLVDWCFAGLVAVDPHPKASRHYAAMDIDGDDLVILSRSGDKTAKSAHDGNMITFHRVKNFRDLVY